MSDAHRHGMRQVAIALAELQYRRPAARRVLLGLHSRASFVRNAVEDNEKCSERVTFLSHDWCRLDERACEDNFGVCPKESLRMTS